MPFGMVQFTPVPQEEPCGFVTNILSGSAFPDMGHFPVLPVKGSLSQSPGHMFNRQVHISDATASPGDFRCKVQGDIWVELSATTRTGIACFTFPEGSGEGTVTLGVGINSNRTLSAAATLTDSQHCEGYAQGSTFCGFPVPYKVYFCAEFDRPAKATGSWKDDALKPGSRFCEGEESGLWFTFDLNQNREVRYKIALSYVSVENARLNLESENPGWEIEPVRTAAKQAWNGLLGKIELDGKTPARQKRIFYTNLYHALIHPTTANDVNGEYIGADFKVHKARRTQYFNFSNWDTYRSQIQLLSILLPQVASDIAVSHYDFATQAGDAFPRWVFANIETGIMQGEPSTILISNAWAFGAREYDPHRIFEIMKRDATIPGLECQGIEVRPGLQHFLDHGWYPTASLHLEMTSADFAMRCFAIEAKGSIWESFQPFDRSKSWRILYNPESGWLQSRRSDGSFHPLKHGWMESTAQTYFWMVPYDLDGLISLIGRDEAEKRLDELFSELTTDIFSTHYSISNEPAMHIPWVYNWVGRPDKASATVKSVCEEMFGDSPDTGMPGSDDMGALGSWYVFATLGLYPMIPGVGGFSLSLSLVDGAVIHLPSSDIRIRKAKKGGSIASVSLDGNAIDRAWIDWSALEGGAELIFTATTKPGAWGTGTMPPSFH